MENYREHILNDDIYFRFLLLGLWKLVSVYVVLLRMLEGLFLWVYESKTTLVNMILSYIFYKKKQRIEINVMITHCYWV